MESSILVLIVVVIAAALVAAWGATSLRRDRLRRRFGPEYDRAVEDADRRRDAEGQLRDRLKRHRALELHPLDPDVAAAYSQRWIGIQARFVDTPEQACADAERLLEQVLRLRGYPVDEDFDTQADLVSVDHPNLTVEYRRAHEAMRATGGRERRLEELRSSFVIYRNLFSDLLSRQGDRPAGDAPTTDDAEQGVEEHRRAS